MNTAPLGLKTLADRHPQEVFDFMVNHLRSQGKQSANASTCLYRSPDA